MTRKKLDKQRHNKLQISHIMPSSQMSKNYLKRSYKKKRFVFKTLSQFQFSVFNNFSSQKFWDRDMCPLSFPPDTATAVKRNKLQPPLTLTSNCLFRRPSLKANSSCLVVTTHKHTYTHMYIYHCFIILSKPTFVSALTAKVQ